MFRLDGLQCQVFLNPVHMQSLHIKVTQGLPQPQDMKPQYQWSLDDLQVSINIIKFFANLIIIIPKLDLGAVL